MLIRIQKKSRYSEVLQCVLFAIGVSSGFAVAQTPGDTPLISITEPALNQTYSDDLVTVGVHFRQDAIASTFRAQVNGEDVTSLFEATSLCQSSGVCDVKAFLPADKLLHGTNAISVEVNGPNDTVADNGVKFDYEAPVIRTAPVSKLIPSVAVSSVKLIPGHAADDYKSYEIVVGPGPNFPQVAYKASDLTCSDINSVEVLVLQRKTLSPEDANSRGCFATASALTSFLKNVPKNDLVIVNNFLGQMQGIDTTAMGGTNYANAGISTYYYNAIGVAGAPAGTAYESYQPNTSHTPRLGADFLPPLVGSLMLDTANNYYFAPKDYPEIKVMPGTSGSCASASFGTFAPRVCTPANSLGAFWILAIDRQLGSVTDSYVLDTNSNDIKVRNQSISDFAYLLNSYYKANDLLVITTVGVPFRTGTDVKQSLWDSINRLGGNGYVLPQLTASDSAYTLVSSPDAAYTSVGGAKESTTLRKGETGKLELVLGRNRLNQFVVYQDYPGSTLAGLNGNEWPSTLFQQPKDWPAWKNGQENAYLDLTSSNNYPELKAKLGCTNCRPLREYYDGSIPTCTPPSILAFPLNTLTFKPGFGYEEADFKAVINQLSVEQGYESNVYGLCGFVRQLTNSTETTLQRQLKAVGDQIDSSLLKKAQVAEINANALAKYSKYATAASALPVVGPAFSAVATTLNSTALLVPNEAGIPESFTFTLAQLNDQNNTLFGDRMTLVISKLFTAIANDWGKLSIIGKAYGEGEKPWFFCVNCTDSTLPINALPLISLGAKRNYYMKLLPTVYDLDLVTEQADPDPKRIVRTITFIGGNYCFYPYAGAPSRATWDYPSINKSTTSDIFMLAETQKAKGAGVDELRFPTTGLVSDMVDAPIIDLGKFKLSGGAGLTFDDLFRTGSNMNIRLDTLPGKAGCKIPF